ncbi:sterol desaturase family protein [Lysobacter enzymogenes]|nr:sterol desaturase family protein [Lysobacter enzymogenes]
MKGLSEHTLETRAASQQEGDATGQDGAAAAGAGIIAEPNADPVTPAATTRLDFLRHCAHPLLMLAVAVYAYAAIARGWDLGGANFAFVLLAIGYLALLERLIPYERRWLPDRREWGLYGVYFFLTVVGGALAQIPLMAAVSAVAPLHPALPLWAEIPLALLLSSLASYAVHRAGHDIPLLWRLHGVHHVPDKVNVGNNGVNHVLDVTLAQFVVQFSLALSGFSAHALFAVGIFVIAQGYFVHANIDVRLGWLNHVLASPELHRMHHSADKHEAGHFGSDLSVWDRLFGSYTWRPGKRPRRIGLFAPGTFPPNRALLSTLLHPLRPRRYPPMPPPSPARAPLASAAPAADRAPP